MIFDLRVVETRVARAVDGAASSFLCMPTADGDYFRVCQEDDPDPLSCKGLSRFCDLFGHGDVCHPEGTCGCRIEVPAPTP